MAVMTSSLTAYAEGAELPPHHEWIVTMMSDVTERGHLFVVPSERWLTKGVCFLSGLVRFEDGSALLYATNSTSKKILISKGAALACVTQTEPISVSLKAAPSEEPFVGRAISFLPLLLPLVIT